MQKKIIVFILVLCLLPLYAFAADDDPIVGVWYADLEVYNAPPAAANTGYSRTIMIMSLENTGDIIVSEIDYKGTETEFIEPYVAGKWEKTGHNKYNISIIGVGSQTAFMRNGVLFAAVLDVEIYFGFHKMTPFDWYTEILRAN